MKKIVAIFSCLLLFTGCSITMSTPTREVENFLGKYQKQDSEVVKQLYNVVNKDTTMNEEQKKEYKEVMKKQYQNLTYKIKDETIDGDNATVEVEIEVYDFYKTSKEADTELVNNNSQFLGDDGLVDNSKFMDYKIKKLKETKEKVTYTLNLTLTKKDKEWKMNDITDSDREKIHGIYNY